MPRNMTKVNRIKALSDHQNGFAVVVALLTQKRDVRGDRYIARHLLPHEMKIVDAKPHVLTAAVTRTRPCAIEAGSARMQHCANI